jgi:hypothetical protein
VILGVWITSIAMRVKWEALSKSFHAISDE